jgi:hypothetical protein
MHSFEYERKDDIEQGLTAYKKNELFYPKINKTGEESPVSFDLQLLVSMSEITTCLREFPLLGNISDLHVISGSCPITT